MCGITGIFDLSAKRVIDRDLLCRMNNIQEHRGPDEEGVYFEDGVGLGHRRLSIIDLSNGQQPLFDSTHTVCVVYNGEIYNFKEIRELLKKDGYQFKTQCDTEVVVYAWMKWKEDCVKHFRGMFAFAIYDKSQNSLFLARDRLGIKPLYYSVTKSNLLLFSSELKSLLEHPEVERDIDPLSVEDYFAFGYIPDPRSAIKEVKKLEPGCAMTFRRNSSSPKHIKYWDICFDNVSQLSYDDAGEVLVEKLTEAVKIRLLSDVPLGAFLSGGIDSSAVVAMMANIMNEPVKSCSISFGESDFDESKYADQVARHFKTDHHVNVVDPNDFSLLDKLASIYDEPFADSSALPTYRVCELAKKRVTVALSGDGGDENFAGYSRYRWHKHEESLRNILPHSVRRPIFGIAGHLYPKADWAPKLFRAKSTFQALSRNTINGYFNNIAVVNDSNRANLFSGTFKKELQGYSARAVLEGHDANSNIGDAISKIQYLDFKTYLPGDILTKVDRASMANSLEVRVPILDHEFVELVATLPSNFKLRGREGKSVFKHSLRKYLPDNILYRKKMGFAVPLSEWFRGPLKNKVEKSLQSEHLLDSGMFNQKFVKSVVQNHMSKKADHGTLIWTLLMYEAFQKRLAS